MYNPFFHCPISNNQALNSLLDDQMRSFYRVDDDNTPEVFNNPKVLDDLENTNDFEVFNTTKDIDVFNDLENLDEISDSNELQDYNVIEHYAEPNSMEIPYENNYSNDYRSLNENYDVSLADTRAPQQDVNRILALLNIQRPYLVRNFERFGVSRVLTNIYFSIAISYTIDNANRYSGNINQRTNAIFNNFRRSYTWIFVSLRSSGVPNNIIDSTFKEVIEFTLMNTGTPTPPNPPTPSNRWSKWEDLGGVLSFGPGVSS